MWQLPRPQLRSILVGHCRYTFAAVQLERDKRSQQQLSEVRGVIARYRGPLLESAIDLEQRLWHLVRRLLRCSDSLICAARSVQLLAGAGEILYGAAVGNQYPIRFVFMCVPKVADQCSATDCAEDIRYLMYTLAQASQLQPSASLAFWYCC